MKEIWLTNMSRSNDSIVAEVEEDMKLYGMTTTEIYCIWAIFYAMDCFTTRGRGPLHGGFLFSSFHVLAYSARHLDIFHTSVLLEPFIQPNKTGATGLDLVTVPLNRQDTWPSTFSYYSYFKNGLKESDARIVDRYTKHGIRDFPRPSPRNVKPP